MNQVSYRNLPLLLLKAREGFMSHFRPILNEHGVTEQQWRIIQSLATFGDQEPRQLCEHCMILSPSMAGILKRMEEVGYIEKIPMEDQRRITIRLTDTAKTIYDKVKVDSTAEYQEIEEKFGKETVQELYNILDKMVAEL